VIRFHQASFSYREGDPILAGVDLEIGPGLTLLLGPNGCGKSTLLKLAAGIERPETGRVEINGRDLWVDEAEARRGLVYVPEQPDLTPYATVGEILDLVCRLRGEPRQRGREALETAGLGGLAHRSVRELSMGQRRRAVLAAAFVGTPSHALLDEPLEAMDRGAREDLLAWVDRLLASGAAVVVVSHDIEPFVPRASRALGVRSGRCIDVGTLPDDASERLALLDRLARGEESEEPVRPSGSAPPGNP
jgi:ABC-type multidrug transport system ATPase subunit